MFVMHACAIYDAVEAVDSVEKNMLTFDFKMQTLQRLVCVYYCTAVIDCGT